MHSAQSVESVKFVEAAPEEEDGCADVEVRVKDGRERRLVVACAAGMVLVLVGIVAAFFLAVKPNTSSRESSADGARYVAIFGSSVASGCCATDNLGWWHALAEALPSRVSVENYAISGATAAGLLPVVVSTLDARFANETRTSVIVSLSLANEGLFLTDDEDVVDSIAEQYLVDLRQIADAAAARVEGVVALGSTYANGYALDVHWRALVDVNARLRTWPYPVLDFYNATAKAKDGRWRDDLEADPGHPNDLGHRRMFEAIDLALFSSR